MKPPGVKTGCVGTVEIVDGLKAGKHVVVSGAVFIDRAAASD